MRKTDGPGGVCASHSNYHLLHEIIARFGRKDGLHCGGEGKRLNPIRNHHLVKGIGDRVRLLFF